MLVIKREAYNEKSINENSINSLLNVLKTRDRLLILIFNSTACKTGEIIDLKLKDISRYQIIINEREIPISESLYREIQNYALELKLNPENYLFSSRQSEKITTKRIRQIIQKNSKNVLGFKLNPKELRKASICEKIKNENIEEVKKQVGLKRFDVKAFISEVELNKIKNSIKDNRTKLLFSLLLNGFKSITIKKLKVNEINELKINNSTKKELKSYVSVNKLSENDPLFLTRQKSSLSKESIFKIVSQVGKQAGIKLCPRDLNNTAVYKAINSENPKDQLDKLGLKFSQFYLHGGFLSNE
jgi:integrase